MSRKLLLWLMALVVIIPALIGTGYYIYWDQYKRYAPVTITHNQAEIQALLDKADYVSPGRNSQQVLYLITFRSCVPCRAFEEQEFPKYDAAGIDTRVIVFAPADVQGLKKTTVAERSTIAELWLSRKWEFYQAWFSSSDANWKAEGLPVADNDFARSAVVSASRDFTSQLQPYLAANKVPTTYPLVIWRDQNNMLKVCSCTDAKAYHFIREDLGAPSSVGASGGNMFQIPSGFFPTAGSESSAAQKEEAKPAPQPAPAQPTPAPQPVAAEKAAKPASGYRTDFGPDDN
ncbi:MAG TPA: hypothetical protein VG839_01320 [Asticcacaulis sp.]|nr:hypothetical protein [Asticcacaulis sp.]